MNKLAYSTAEVCDLVPISISRLLELIHSNEIIGVKIGRRYVIPAASLNAYLDRLVTEKTKRPA